MVSFELYVTITKQKSINNRILHKTEYMYVFRYFMSAQIKCFHYNLCATIRKFAHTFTVITAFMTTTFTCY